MLLTAASFVFPKFDHLWMFANRSFCVFKLFAFALCVSPSCHVYMSLCVKERERKKER